jgi:hypothetical protein
VNNAVRIVTGYDLPNLCPVNGMGSFLKPQFNVDIGKIR